MAPEVLNNKTIGQEANLFSAAVVGMWCKRFTQQGIMGLFVDQYNKNSKKFMWSAAKDSILVKIERLCKEIAGTVYYYVLEKN